MKNILGENKNLRYKSEYTRNKKGEIINYSNTNT